MPYSITCLTKILTLAIALVLFISVCVLCEFAMLPDFYMLLSLSAKKGTLFLLKGQLNTSGIKIIKDLTICLPLHYFT